MKRNLGVTCLILMVLVAMLPARSPAAEPGGGSDFCAVSCWNGSSCRAVGPSPCECRCRGFLGLGGAICTCGGMQFASPMEG